MTQHEDDLRSAADTNGWEDAYDEDKMKERMSSNEEEDDEIEADYSRTGFPDDEDDDDEFDEDDDVEEIDEDDDELTEELDSDIDDLDERLPSERDRDDAEEYNPYLDDMEDD